MVDSDTHAVSKAVDSLLNYETVKYFNAEDRETQRYGRAVDAYMNAAVRNETSLALLNIGQSAITNIMMAAAMGRSEEHTSELQSLMRISYAVFCLKKKNK